MFRRITMTACTCAAFALAMGCVSDTDEHTDGEPLDTAEQAIAPSTRQFASHYLKNIPTTDGRTQWTSVVIDNPNPTPATVTLTIHRNDGAGALGVLTKTIPARGWYNSYGDAAWLNGVAETDTGNHRSAGWVELTSSVPVVATNRVTVRTGTTFDSPVSLLNDAPFLKSPSTQLFSTFFLRNWPSGMSGITQWTDMIVNNPNTAPAYITVRVHKSDGSGVHATLTRTVPAKGAWSSYGEAGWLGIPPTDAGLGGALGWIEVLSDAPVVASSRTAMRSGNTYNASPTLLDDAGFEAQASSTLRAPLVLKGAPAGGTITQWSTPVVVNPSSTPTTINVVVRRNDGPALTSFSRTVPAKGWWNAYGDASWSSIASNSGWAEITSSQPIFGVNRVMFRNGSTASSPFTLFDDEPLAQAASSQHFASTYLKKWPSTAGFTQWSDLVVNNPNTYAPVTITVRILKVDGSGDLTFFTRQIPAGGAWHSSTDAQWLSLPDSDPANGRSSGWVELTSSAPVTALHRTNLRSGDTATSPIALFEDTLLDGNVGSACDPLGPGRFCARTTEEPVSRFKELMIVNPSVVNDPTRTSNASNGHWSFRWLMEQMVTPGADPSDFVASWIRQGFAAGTVNGFPVQDRSRARALLDSWPKIPGTSRIDLGQSPFKLLAIVNRIDLASSNGAGEARFVFGLDQGGSGQPMTVIFEYKLPASASRQVWAQRFHALGALPFGADYNARLQMITDEYAARGANPAGVNGSALGQLRTNELLDPFFSPWQLREFNLVSGSPARLQITTTKQTPDGAFDGSGALASYVSNNAQAILDGTAIVPASMLGGESNADFQWTVPGASEAVRHAFAQQTCNGCHATEVPVVDSFYHVSPMRAGGADGTGRLSLFLINTDLPFREDVLQATLCEGSCAGVGPVLTTASRVH